MSGRPVLVICGLDTELRMALTKAVMETHANIVIIDDPHNAPVDELRKDFRKFAKMIEFREELPAARAPIEHKGPQPRTRYPRRR